LSHARTLAWRDGESCASGIETERSRRLWAVAPTTSRRASGRPRRRAGARGGRALAGAAGDKEARIFTTCLEAELVSVAGIYRTFEGGVPADLAQKPATVGLTADGTLNVAPLATR